MNQAVVEVSLTALKAEKQQPIMNQAVVEAVLTTLKAEWHRVIQVVVLG